MNIIVSKLISPDFAEILGQSILFNKLNEGRQYAHPISESLLMHLKPKIEEHTGLKLEPTYSYVRVYSLGDKVDKHLDIPSCEISVSINLKYDKSRFPLQIEGKTIDLEQGDGFIYKYCDSGHEYQGEEGSQQVQVFLYYVDVNGPYSEYKYDKRSSLGLEKSKLLSFPRNCVYWSKVENHEKIKKLNYVQEISYKIPKTTHNIHNENNFLDDEDINEIIWDKIDDMIYQINKSENFTECNIRPSNTILYEYFVNNYDTNDFIDSHDHLVNPIYIDDEMYFPSFSGIYILHDKNDMNNTVFRTSHGIQLPFLPYFSQYIIDTSEHDDVKEGVVIIFPSTLEHFVKPCLKERITISFNMYSRYDN